jgi:predicted transposase YdaD
MTEQAYKVLEEISSDPAYRLMAEMREHDEATYDEELRRREEVGREEGREEGIEVGIDKVRQEGTAKSILRVLSAREITISSEQRQRIFACSDGEQLGAWITRAATMNPGDDLFVA